MLDKIKYNFKHKKILWLLLPLILCLISILVLTSNAFTNPKVSPGVVTSVNISSCGEFALHDKSASINLTNSYPMTDNMGLKTTPYTFDVKNTCDGSSSFNVYLIVTSDSEIPDNLVKINLDTNNKTDLVTNLTKYALENTSKQEFENKSGKAIKQAYLLDTKSITNGASSTFNLKMWLDKNTGNEYQGKKYSAFIVVGDSTSSAHKMNLSEAILANNGGSTAISAKGTPNFATAATTDEGMYAAPDDYGTSYYFRGAVSNNWVKFNNMYWRIVRINGNNTVKLVYSGTTAPTETEKVIMAEVSAEIGMSAFNTNVNSAEYVGYKYTLGDAHGTSTDSTIKTVIDNWYNANLLSQTSKIADIVYCNDRNTYSGIVENNSFSGTGIGNTPTHFGDKRLISEANWLAGGSGPILTCPNKSDAFTVTDTTHGNTSLQYPIALLTADELVLAGTPYGQSNSSYYLYTSKQYWTLSPIFMYSNGYAVQFIVNSFGDVSNANVFSNLAIRPVISLTSNIEATGDGTWNNPYIVQ
jgi:hypothetical protein